MNPFDIIVSKAEAAHGLEQGELDNIWNQESRRSLQLDLPGPGTRHGRAKGPFQIMEKFWGPVPDSFEGQANRSAEILAQGGNTRAERAASYYGKGKAPPGHPTTAQYVARVTGTQTYAYPSGTPYRNPLMPEQFPANPYSSIPPVTPFFQQAPAPTLADRLASSPLIRMGLNVLAANQPGSTFGQAVGGGMERGLRSLQQWEMNQERMRQSEMFSRYRLYQMQQREQSRQQLVQALVQRGMHPDQAQAMVANAPQVAAQALMPQAAAPTFVAGSTPTGYVTEYDPAGRPISAQPVPGTKEHAARMQAVGGLDQALSNLDALTALVEKHGSEMFGENSAAMGQLHGQIIADVAALRNLGVLQPSELEHLQKTLVNPASVTAPFTLNATTLSGYKTLRNMFQQKRDRVAQSYEGAPGATGSAEDPLGIMK